MEHYEVKLTNHAVEQMAEIADYMVNTLHAPAAAKSFQQMMYSEMAKYATMPNRMQLLEDEPWHSRGIRKIQVKNFYAYYWVDETKKAVWFIAVVYARRDQLNELMQLPEQ